MLKYLLIGLLLATPALAQQQQQTPLDRALGGKLLEEINTGVAMRAQIIEQQEKIADLQKQIEELKKQPGTKQ